MADNNGSIPQPQTPFIPNANSSPHEPIEGNAGLPGRPGDPNNFDTPAHNRRGTAIGIQPSNRGMINAPHTVTPPPRG